MEQEQILGLLGADFPWRDRLRLFFSIDSTNNAAKSLAVQGAPHGTVLIADRQTGGRGRMGRSFQSPPGMGVYLSALLRPMCPPQQLMHLTCAIGVAMCDAVQAAAGFRPQIKWINDLVYGGHKLGGILVELGLGPNGLADYAVAGIGINCNQKAEDFPPELREVAASLSMFAPQRVDRCRLAAEMMRSLENISRRFLPDKGAIMAQYRQDCMTIGQQISLLQGGQCFHGQALDIDDEGALLVRLDSGELRTVNSGEASVRGMYGYV